MILEVKDLTKIYEGKTVLKNINLKIHRGDIYILIGPSGAGKTTLLRIIDLLEKPSSGEVIFNGVKISDISKRQETNIRRRIAFLHQKTTLFNMSVFENIAYGLSLRGLPSNIIKNKVKETLIKLGLNHLEKQNATLLSGGEAQRTALARCMVLEPELLLLDEPTANLDPPNVTLIESLIKEMNSENGTTIILATHNMAQAKRLGGRVGVILNGEIIEEGEGERLFNKPSSERVKAFINGDFI
ncbi:MAG: ATP-binding cassette domain-containing protein [Candidatus Odinarchaeum yellowstonii]|uniref:Molybdate/tungstate import ATP-binding protein WtpC n=1 Tax=Odinarchaeota yellowstonii (strain LCB_4) TaxID=1841599 RepID=A0AAF0IBM7_ODILC|nr:MAG: ATP-binding cassette domain-containing protein [Candidatus Odinarchaeum yellowstonii]